MKPDVFQINVTDHYSVFCIIICDYFPSSKSKQHFYTRDYNKLDLAVYENNISTIEA